MSNKIDEFLISLSSNAPQVICLTEHHLMTEQIENVNLGQHTSGVSFCRQISMILSPAGNFFVALYRKL